MTFFHSDRRFGDLAQPGSSGVAELAPEDMLAPIIAGAYARGVAETLDLLGLPGLLLDGAGEILYAGRATAPLLRGPLRLRMRHLIADHAEDNHVLAAFIADAVGSREAQDRVHLPRSGIALRRLPHADGSAVTGQLLRAVVLVGDGATSVGSC